MSEANLERLQADLSIIRQAGGFDKPYTAEDVPLLLFMSASSLAAAGIAVWAPESGRGVLLAFVPAMILFARLAARRRRDRAGHPGLWREVRSSLIAAAVVTPLAILWMVWERSLGIPREVVGAGAVFFVGVGNLLVGLLDYTRRAYLANGVALMVYGIVIPACTRQQVVAGGGITLCAASLGAAAIVWWQLRADAASGN